MHLPDQQFESLYIEHFDRLVRSLTAITGDSETAVDAVQEAFVKAALSWRRVGRLDDPIGWIRRVAINRSRDFFRSDSRRRKREHSVYQSSSRLGASDGGAAGPWQASETVEANLALVDRLNQLPRRQRIAAALFYLEDLAVVDVASAMGISQGAVKFHLNKARAALKEAVQAESRLESRDV